MPLMYSIYKPRSKASINYKYTLRILYKIYKSRCLIYVYNILSYSKYSLIKY